MEVAPDALALGVLHRDQPLAGCGQLGRLRLQHLGVADQLGVEPQRLEAERGLGGELLDDAAARSAAAGVPGGIVSAIAPSTSPRRSTSAAWS